MLSALQAKDVGIIEEELIKLSQRGVPCSRFDVAQLYEAGDIIEPSAPDAIRWYERGRTGERDPRCMFALARIYYFGLLGATIDMERSNQLFRESSDHGMHEASIVLVNNILDGHFVGLSADELQRILSPAVSAGYVMALRLSADVYHGSGRWVRGLAMRALSNVMAVLLRRDPGDARLYMSRWARNP